MPENFHFLAPEWLYMLFPLAVILLLLHLSSRRGHDPWQRVIDSNLLPWLRVEKGSGKTAMPIALLAMGWMITVIALANPVWEKRSQPVYQTDLARVIVLDLSQSMVSADLKPSRLQRARFKVRDILANRHEGVTGLVVFAGDAFAVSPLTRDTGTIAAMLPALEPGIMPAQGSRADLGIEKAGELMKQAGRLRGEILLIADGYANERTVDVARQLSNQGYITSVLGIGTPGGAPLPTGKGGFVRDDNGDIVTTRLDVTAMQRLANAGGGDYISLTADTSDIRQLMSPRIQGAREPGQDEYNQTTHWKETGPWLALLIVPFALMAFRRGWVMAFALLLVVGMPEHAAMALTTDDLWQRQDQQAYRALMQGESEKAAQLAEDPLTRGAAEYRQGNYQAALDAFSRASGADADYNRGNALARLGKYEEALQAYDKALQARDDMEDARYNRKLIEELLEQQRAQQEQSTPDQSASDDNSDSNSEKKSEEKQNEGSNPSQAGQQDQQSAQQAGGEPGQQQSNPQAEAGSEQQANDQAGEQQDSEGSSNQQADQQNGSEQQHSANAFAEAAEQAGKMDESAEENEQDATTNTEREENPGSGGDVEQRSPPTLAKEGGDQQEADSHSVNAQASKAVELTSEEQIAAEQWLRRIPDDPAGLLRRKLRYQYIQRGGQAGGSNETQPW
jgi:Ca-activated chloride channel family protein